MMIASFVRRVKCIITFFQSQGQWTVQTRLLRIQREAGRSLHEDERGFDAL